MGSLGGLFLVRVVQRCCAGWVGVGWCGFGLGLAYLSLPPLTNTPTPLPSAFMAPPSPLPFLCHSVHSHRPLTFHRVLNDRILAWAAGAQHERPGGRSLTLPPSLPLFLPSLPLSSSSPALPLSSFSMPPPPPTPDSSSAVTSHGLFPLGGLFLLPQRGPPPPSSPSG